MGRKKKRTVFSFQKRKIKSDDASPLEITVHNGRQENTDVESSGFNHKNVRCKSTDGSVCEGNEVEIKSEIIDVDCSDNADTNFSTRNCDSLIPKENSLELSENTLDNGAQRSLRNRSQIFKPKKYASLEFVNTLDALADIEKKPEFKISRRVGSSVEVPNFGNANSAEHLQKLLNSGSIRISQISFLNKSSFNPQVNLTPLELLEEDEEGEAFFIPSPARVKRRTEHGTANCSSSKRLKSSDFLQEKACSNSINKAVINYRKILPKSVAHIRTEMGETACSNSISKAVINHKKILLNSLAHVRTVMEGSEKSVDWNLYRERRRQKFLDAISCYLDDKEVNYQNNVMYENSLEECPHRTLSVTSIFKPSSFIRRSDRQRTHTERKSLDGVKNEKPHSVHPEENIARSDELSKDCVAISTEKSINSDCNQCLETFKVDEYLLRSLYKRFCNEMPREMFNEIKRRKKSILKRILLQKWDMKLDTLFVILANGTISALFGEKKEAFLNIARRKRYQMYAADFKLWKNRTHGNLKRSELSNGKILQTAMLQKNFAMATQPSIVKQPNIICSKLLASQILGKHFKQPLTDSVTINGQTKNRTCNVIVESKTKQKKPKLNDVTIELQTKSKKDNARPNFKAIGTKMLLQDAGSDSTNLPDLIQMVECALPPREATNHTALQKNKRYLFRQTFKSFGNLIQCFFCRNNPEFKLLFLPLHLKTHYETKHHFSVHMCVAKFNTDSVLITVPRKLTDKTVLGHACLYCKSKLKVRAAVKQHYSDVHKKTAIFVTKEEIPSLEKLIYCSLCNQPSKTLLMHRLHMVQEHAIQTYTCGFCYFCSYHPTKLVTHLKEHHPLGLQCSDCCECIIGQEKIRRHILSFHVVKTGIYEWHCTKCLVGFKDLEELVTHGRVCIENAELSSKSTSKSIDCCSTDISCKNDSVTVNSEENVAEEIANIDEKHPCFLCDMNFSTLCTYKEHIHHVHKQWVVKRKGLLSTKVDSSEKCGAESNEATRDTQNPCTDSQETTCSTEKNPNEHSDKQIETSRLSMAEASELSVSPQCSTEDKEISNSTNEHLEAEPLNTLSSESANGTHSEDEVSFSSLPDNQQLLKIGFPEKKGHFCWICNTVIENYRLYYMHMHNLHKLRKMFKCSVSSCWKVFNCSSRFEVHALEHNQKYEFFCLLCNTVFPNEEGRQLHWMNPVHQLKQKMKEINGGNYRCKICNTKFYFHQSFVKHMETDTHKYVCSVCNTNYSQARQRRLHIQSSHLGLANTCEECGMRFPDTKSVVKHFEVHNFIFACSVCGAQFFQKEQVDIHAEVHRKSLVCPVKGCKQWFSFGILQYYLFYHLIKFHKMFEDLACPQCNEVFTCDTNLYKHWIFEDNVIKCKDGSVVSLALASPEPETIPKSEEMREEESGTLTEEITIFENEDVEVLDVLKKTTGDSANAQTATQKSVFLNEGMAFGDFFKKTREDSARAQKTSKKSVELSDNVTLGSLACQKSQKMNSLSESVPASVDKVLQLITIKEEPVEEESILLDENRTKRFKTSQNVVTINRVTNKTVANKTLLVAPTSAKSKVNADNNVTETTKKIYVLKSTPSKGNMECSWNNPQIVKLHENKVLMFGDSRTLADRNKNLNNSNTVNVNVKQRTMRIMQNPITNPVLFKENRKLNYTPSAKSCETNQDVQFNESNVDRNMLVITVKQEPVEESIQLDENMTLKFIPSEKPAETDEDMQDTETNVDINLPVLTIKQEPMEEPIPSDESRTFSLEPSAKSLEVEKTLEQTVQVWSVKQEPPEESFEPCGDAAIEKSIHFPVNQEMDAVNLEQIQNSIVLERNVQAATNASDLQLDVNRQIPAQIRNVTEQSVPSNNLRVSTLQSPEQNLNVRQLDGAAIRLENTLMHIPVEMIQLACAGCLCMFESKDHFLEHVCTGQISDDAAGRIVVVPEDSSGNRTVEWVGQAAIPEQLVATNHPAFSNSSVFQS